MSANEFVVNKKIFSQFIPLNSLSQVHLEEIVRKFSIEEVDAGKYLFREGETDNRNVYLVSGELVLVENKKETTRITAGKEQARYPIAHAQPRQLSAKAAVKSRIVRIDTNLLEMLLTWDQSSSYLVQDMEEEDDWMSRMLQSDLFVRIPAANIQKMLMKMQEVKVRAGDVVIRQGDEGDYYYIIKQGRCSVGRKGEGEDSFVKLAELSGGDSFGEDALISGKQRNATITMLTDGSLMKLGQKDFTELLKEPSLDVIGFPWANEMAQKQKAVFLDVRFAGEYANSRIKGSLNMPLSSLRENLTNLDKQTQYITCCDTGKRSATAAFLMGQKGYQAHVLESGILTVPKECLEQDALLERPEDAGKTEEFSAQNRKELIAEKNLLQQQLQDVGKKVEQQSKAIEAQKALIAQLQKEQEAQQKNGQSLLKNKEAENEKVIEGLRDRIALTEDAKIQFENQIADYEREQIAMHDRNQALQQEMAAIKAKYDESKQHSDADRNRVSELEKVNARLSAKEEQANDKREAEKASVVFLQSQILEKDKNQRLLERQVTELGGALAKLDKEHDSQKNTLEDVRNKHREAVEKIESEKAKANDLRGLLGASEKELTSLREIQTKLASVERALQQRNTEVENLLKQQESLNIARLDLQKRDEAKARLLEEARAENARIQLEHAKIAEGFGQQAQKTTSESTGLKIELDKTKIELQRFVQSAASKESELQEALQKLSAEQVASQQLKEERAKLQSDFEKMELEVSNHVANVQRLEKSLAESKEDRESSKKEQQERMATLTQQIDKLREEHLRVEKELAHASEWESKAQLLEQDKARISSEREDLLVKATALEKEHQYSRGEADASHKESAEKTAKLVQLEKELQERNQALQSLENQVSQLNSATSQQQQALTELSAELGSKTKESDKRLAEVESAQHRIAEMESLLAKSEGEGEALNRLTKERQELEQNLAGVKQEMQGLSADLALKAQHAAKLQAEVEAGQQRIQEMASLLENSEADGEALNRLTNDRQQLGEKLTAAKEELAEASVSKIQLAGLLEQRDVQITQLQNEIAEESGASEQLFMQLDQAKMELRQQLEADFAAQLEENNLAWSKRGSETEEGLRASIAELESRVSLKENAVRVAEEKGAEAELRIAALTTELQKKTTEIEVPVEFGVDEKLLAQLEEVKAQREFLESQVVSMAEARKALELSLQAAEDKAKLESNLRVEVESERRGLQDQLQIIQTANEMDGLFGDDDARKPAPLDRDSQLAHALSSQYVTALHAPDVKKKSSTTTWMLGAVAVLLLAANLGQFFWLGNRESAAPTAALAIENDATDLTQGNLKTTSAAKSASNDGRKSSGNNGPLADKVKPEPAVKGATFKDVLSAKGAAPEMISIPAGDFMLGSNKGYADADEQPHHSVRLQAFAISQKEITFDQYEAFSKANGKAVPSDNGWGRGNRPVINVSWKDATAYAQWLSKQTGKNYRLPSEAEWEYVAKGGTDYNFWWGGEVGQNRANCFDCGSGFDGRGTAPTGSFPENQFGVFDQLGNVAEWVEDCIHQGYDGAPKNGSAWVEASCSKRVVRGGSYSTASNSLRVTKRSFFSPGSQIDTIGFRVVRD